MLAGNNKVVSLFVVEKIGDSTHRAEGLGVGRESLLRFLPLSLLPTPRGKKKLLPTH